MAAQAGKPASPGHCSRHFWIAVPGTAAGVVVGMALTEAAARAAVRAAAVVNFIVMVVRLLFLFESEG